MAVKRGSFTISGTGNTSVIGLSFLPTNVDFFLSGKFGTNDSDVSFSVGGFTASNQSADGSINGRSRSYTDRCIHHYKKVSGTINDAVVATKVSFDDNGGGDYGFTINASAFDSNYQVKYKASDE